MFWKSSLRYVRAYCVVYNQLKMWRLLTLVEIKITICSGILSSTIKCRNIVIHPKYLRYLKTLVYMKYQFKNHLLLILFSSYIFFFLEQSNRNLQKIFFILINFHLTENITFTFKKTFFIILYRQQKDIRCWNQMFD
jgi:hypothetical protein